MTPPSRDGTLEDPFVISMLSAGVVRAIFVGLGIGYGSTGHTLPHADAIAQIIAAVATFIGTTILWFGAAYQMINGCDSGERTVAMWGMGGGYTVLGGWLLSHAVWSLQVPEDRQTQARRPPSVVVGAAF